MASERLSFDIKRGQRAGDRLILRNPASYPPVRDHLECVVGQGALPRSLTIGYYRRLDEPRGVWCFFPLCRPVVAAALEIEAVQRRVCCDLAQYIESALADADGLE